MCFPLLCSLGPSACVQAGTWPPHCRGMRVFRCRWGGLGGSCAAICQAPQQQCVCVSQLCVCMCVCAVCCRGRADKQSAGDGTAAICLCITPPSRRASAVRVSSCPQRLQAICLGLRLSYSHDGCEVGLRMFRPP